MTRENVLQLLESHGLTTKRLTENEASYEVSVTKNGIELVVTIPFDVLELYLDAKVDETGNHIANWSDYYGESKAQDFEDDLKLILSILSRKEVKLTSDGRNVEYRDGDWKPFFGKDWWPFSENPDRTS